MKTRILILFTIAFIVSCGNQQSQDTSSIVLPVSVEDIVKKPISEVLEVTGTVYALQEAALTSQISGYYRLLNNPSTGRLFVMGDAVKKYQTLIQLFDPEYENSIKLETQKMNMNITQSELEKQKTLFDKGGISLRDLQNAELNYANAKSAYQSAQYKEDNTKIAAPFDGIVVELPYYTQNTRVGSNQPMAKIMNYRSLILTVLVPAREMGRIKTGQKVCVTSYSLQGDTIIGRVDQISPAIDPNSRTFQSVFKIDNPALKFRPGMFVKAAVVVVQKDSAIVISKNLVVEGQRGKSVFVVERGRAQSRILKTGIENAAEIEVVEGLKVGDRIVVKGFETLQGGAKVKVLK